MGLAPTSLLGSNADVLFYGSNTYSATENDVDIRIGYEQCSDAQLCSQVTCRTCSSSDPCPVGSTCLYYDSSSVGGCFINCGGAFDTSCPCDSYCQELYGAGGDLNFCAVTSLFESNSLCSYATPFAVNCSSPRLRQEQYEALSLSAVVSVQNAIEVSTAGKCQVYVSSAFCLTTEDCIDGDICSLDECVNSFCQYSYDTQCQSSSREISQQFWPQRAVLFSIFNTSASQLSFLNDLSSRGRQAAAESGDLSPPPTTLEFPFDYFGNIVQSVQISPLGLLIIPPFLPCTGTFTSPKVMCSQSLYFYGSLFLVPHLLNAFEYYFGLGK